MSKKVLAVFLALGMLMASNAFASRARTLVMGQGEAGLFLPVGSSFFYDDARNIFYNPSYINDFKNWGILEKSNFPNATAEAGAAMSMGNMNFGLYFNRGGAFSVPNQGGAGVARPPYNYVNYYTTNAAMRPVDAFFGMDMGDNKMGVGLTFGSTKSGDNSNTDLTLSAGVQMMGLEPFGWFKIIGNEKIPTAANTESKFKSYGLGFRYKMGEWVPFAGWRRDKSEVTPSAAGSSRVDTAQSSFGAGIGRNMKVADAARMDYSLAFWRFTPDSRNVVPLNIALEGDALSWLTLRGGFGYNFFDRTANNSNGDLTSTRIGAAMHFGKADFEFAIGRNTNITGVAPTETNTGVDAQTFDLAGGFFTAANVQYRW